MKQTKRLNIGAGRRGNAIFSRLLLVSVFALALILPANMFAAPAENNPKEQAAASVSLEDADRIDLSVHDGYVFITTSKPLNVKIFSILGQLISSTRVSPGTTRLKLPARGIYILKAGDITRRITV